mgnify:CR=1 FL=1
MEIKLGAKTSQTFTVTDEMVRGFADLTGDANPIHVDDEYAKKSILTQRIAHGMLIASFFPRVMVNNFLGIGTIYLRQNLSFREPVYIDDEITVILEIISVREDKPIITIKTTCMTRGKIAIDGEALVKYPGI